ncbi:peptidoglycan D,D-transpeptidase FtsI family protein [Neobacillus ginsengisoli]|uniref:serine-type D-Ala-D-Ala carboxypeptidase n=1 Tax=Neobacillus ginsengisoli TaxID=904295 RepID=A0ABT9XXQ9_9BACI|nr:penicillin-binding protein 2 [Neobacillus ginsengisoli]MDQ0199677.1 cell division protein FtsI/penicillin-binding protein 2 [Neobacillus ginsengisoli]
MEKKKKSHFPIRLNLLFFSIFLLFSLLILRLGFVQIVYGENFKRELERKENITINNPVPRGKILDRDLKIIVDNVPKSAITYMNSGASQKEMLETAKKLATLIDIKPEKVTIRDKKDYWLFKYPKIADGKITKKEKDLYKAKNLDDKDLYKLKLDRISNKELKQLNNDDLEVIAIYREFTSAYKHAPEIVKNDNVSQEEFAIVSENLQSLPGVDTTTDWERMYAFNQTLKSVLGNVTNSDEGLPANQLNYFLSRGYSRDDRVGKSYLEWQYEDILHGQKSKVQNVTDKTGSVLDRKVISNGQRGKDLVLSVNMDLQIAVEKIIEEELWAAKRSPGTTLLDRAYVVLMDPHTGEVLTMAGKQIVRNKETGKKEIEDDALGTFTTSYNVGSTVKGATVLTGYKTGAITTGTVFDDTGIKIKGTPLKKSYAYLGKLNEINALKKSSNVYMFHTAIKIGKGQYEYNQPLNFNHNAFETIRNSFASFGLGTRTGIDLPNEQTGFKGPSKLPGFLLDLVIGQYDTYSPMQLAQYVSTIANGGYRMQPHLVKEIREPMKDTTEIGPVFKAIKPTVLNSIDVKKEWMRRVHLGFRKVMQEDGGTAYKFFGDAPYSPAGKTGTAEAFYDGPERSKYGHEPPPVMNLSLVSYAPSSNPEVAMAVLVPWAYQGKEDTKTNLKIGRRVMDTYFAMKKH